MDKDGCGNYITSDVKRFGTEWEAHNHEKKLRDEQYKIDAEFNKSSRGHGLSNLIFTEWLIFAPGAVMVIVFAVT